MTAFLGGVRLQLAMFRRAWDNLLALITVPLFTIAFLAITRHAGRTDLAAYADPRARPWSPCWAWPSSPPARWSPPIATTV